MLQPFKMITIEMKDATTDGMKTVTGKDSVDPVEQLMNSKRFQAIKLEGTTAGKMHQGVIATKSTDVVVGVVGEVFDRPVMGTQVIISGIVPMKCSAAIQAGQKVTVTAAGKIGPAGANSSFGIAVKGGQVDDLVDILLMIGGTR